MKATFLSSSLSANNPSLSLFWAATCAVSRQHSTITNDIRVMAFLRAGTKQPYAERRLTPSLTCGRADCRQAWKYLSKLPPSPSRDKTIAHTRCTASAIEVVKELSMFRTSMLASLLIAFSSIAVIAEDARQLTCSGTMIEPSAMSTSPETVVLTLG